MPPLRRAGSLAATLLLSLAGITCRDMTGPTGPGRVAPTAAALAFSSSVALETGDPVIPVQLARVRLFRLPGETPERSVLDTVVPFGDIDNSKTLTLPITLTMVSERFGIELSLLDDRAQVIYLARDTVVAYTTDVAPASNPIVLRYAGPDTLVTRIALAPGDTTLAIGDAVTLRAVAYKRDGSKTSAWFGFAVHGSSAIKVDQFGVLRASAPVTKGAAWIVARLATGLTDSVAIGALVPAVNLSVSPAQGLTTVGGRLRLSSIALDSTGAVLDGREPNWSSADPTIASVVDGVVTGRSAGMVTITARSERALARAIVTVSPLRVARLVMSDAALSLVAGGAVSVSVLPLSENGIPVPGRSAVWEIRDPRIASAPLASDSAERPVLVRGLSAGTTMLEVTVDGFRASIAVSVKPKPAARVTIVPESASLLVGESISAAVAVRDAAGLVQPGRAVTWSSLAPAVASVDSTGSVTARATGVAGVVASVDGVADTMSVTVRRISRLAISQTAKALDSNGQVVLTFTLKAWDQAGAVIDEQSADWTIVGTAELLNRVGSSTRVRVHATGASVLTATVGDSETTMIIDTAGVLGDPLHSRSVRAPER
ncbi:MAG: Ig domain protein group 2 domain protein [Gemmatimonadetes bacterium]|nr:Ig domain protein group 2 domain protein [Gemmatimonadota bacterium]